MDRVLNRMTPQELNAMAWAGNERVKEGFGLAQMAERIDGIIAPMCGESVARASKGPGRMRVLGVLGIVGVAVGVLVAVV